MQPGRAKVVLIKKETCHLRSSAVDVKDGWSFFFFFSFFILWWPGLFLRRVYLSSTFTTSTSWVRLLCVKTRECVVCPCVYMFSTGLPIFFFFFFISSPFCGRLLLILFHFRIGGAETVAVQLRQSAKRHCRQFDQLRSRPQLAGSGQSRTATLPASAIR